MRREGAAANSACPFMDAAAAAADETLLVIGLQSGEDAKDSFLFSGRSKEEFPFQLWLGENMPHTILKMYICTCIHFKWHLEQFFEPTLGSTHPNK